MLTHGSSPIRPDVNLFSAYIMTVTASTIALNPPRIRAHADECGRWNFGLGAGAGRGAARVIAARVVAARVVDPAVCPPGGR